MPNMCRTDDLRDLPFWLWGVFPPLLLAILGGAALIDPQWYWSLLRKEAGLVDPVTPYVLMPGIVAGFLVWRDRKRLPSRWLGAWVLGTTLACIYFAGEELSWGQHMFGWGTPELLMQLNDQQETNLHNMSSWFDQKPRVLVEFWVIVAGTILPLWRRWQGKQLNPDTGAYWFWPTTATTVAAVLMILVRLPDRLERWVGWDTPLTQGASEVQEYYVAVFLSLYLLSLRVRQRQWISS